MSLTARRTLYSIITAFGFALTVPFAIESRRLRAAASSIDPWSVEPALELVPLLRLAALSLVGFALATGFLYAALSVGHPAAWRPKTDGPIHCDRCGTEVGFGARACPGCDQQYSW